MPIVSQAARNSAAKSAPGSPFFWSEAGHRFVICDRLGGICAGIQRNCREMRRKLLNFSASFSGRQWPKTATFRGHCQLSPPITQFGRSTAPTTPPPHSTPHSAVQIHGKQYMLLI
jgi:hypothetical protein